MLDFRFFLTTYAALAVPAAKSRRDAGAPAFTAGNY